MIHSMEDTTNYEYCSQSAPVQTDYWSVALCSVSGYD